MRYLPMLVFFALAACSGGHGMVAPVPPGERVGDAASATAGRYRTIFAFSDGATCPGLVALNGTLYGTTDGGARGDAVFALTPSGSWRAIHFFAEPRDGSDPGVLVAVNGELYGTTQQGGLHGAGCAAEGCGVVYAISPAGAERTLYRFKGGADGGNPGSLVAYNGELYGTTAGSAQGTVFAIRPDGVERVVHRFSGGASDGASPTRSLTVLDGVLYGTTTAGGRNGAGTVFALDAGGAEHLRYSFPSGIVPSSPLTVLDGALYGLTFTGGASADCGPRGCGTAYTIAPSGAVRVVHAFVGSTDGAGPDGTLFAFDGSLYGGTSGEGPDGTGTLFGLTPSGHLRVAHAYGNANVPVPGLTALDGVLYGVTLNYDATERLPSTAFAYVP